MNFFSVTLSVCALFFTIFSFWWMNWRKGKIHVIPPSSFAALGSEHAKLILELPLVFYNDGPLPIIIRDLQVVIIEKHDNVPLRFVATVNKLSTDEGRSFATQIPVGGRESVSRICEFQITPGNLVFETKTYRIKIFAKLDNCSKWKQICSFNLDVSKEAFPIINNQFVAHYNSQS